MSYSVVWSWSHTHTVTLPLPTEAMTWIRKSKQKSLEHLKSPESSRTHAKGSKKTSYREQAPLWERTALKPSLLWNEGQLVSISSYGIWHSLFVSFSLIRKEQTSTNGACRSWWSEMYIAHIAPWLLCGWQINLCVLLLLSLIKYTKLQQEEA